MSVIELVGDIAILVGKDVYFKQLDPVFMQYLQSSAAAVRQMGIQKISKMAKAFGGSFILGYLVGNMKAEYKKEK